jgi:hypothetical protein
MNCALTPAATLARPRAPLDRLRAPMVPANLDLSSEAGTIVTAVPAQRAISSMVLLTMAMLRLSAKTSAPLELLRGNVGKVRVLMGMLIRTRAMAAGTIVTA